MSLGKYPTWNENKINSSLSKQITRDIIIAATKNNLSAILYHSLPSIERYTRDLVEDILSNGFTSSYDGFLREYDLFVLDFVEHIKNSKLWRALE